MPFNDRTCSKNYINEKLQLELYFFSFFSVSSSIRLVDCLGVHSYIYIYTLDNLEYVHQLQFLRYHLIHVYIDTYDMLEFHSRIPRLGLTLWNYKGFKGKSC